MLPLNAYWRKMFTFPFPLFIVQWIFIEHLFNAYCYARHYRYWRERDGPWIPKSPLNTPINLHSFPPRYHSTKSKPLTCIFATSTPVNGTMDMLCKSCTMTAMFPGIRGDCRMFLITQDKSFGHFSISMSVMVSDFLANSFTSAFPPNVWIEYKFV